MGVSPARGVQGVEAFLVRPFSLMGTAASQHCGMQCQHVVQLAWVLKMHTDQCKLSSYGMEWTTRVGELTLSPIYDSH